MLHNTKIVIIWEKTDPWPGYLIVRDSTESFTARYPGMGTFSQLIRELFFRNYIAISDFRISILVNLFLQY